MTLRAKNFNQLYAILNNLKPFTLLCKLSVVAKGVFIYKALLAII